MLMDRINDKPLLSHADWLAAEGAAGAGVWVTDLQDSTTICSAETCRLLGLPAMESRLSRDTLVSLIHPEDRGRIWTVPTGQEAYPTGYHEELRIVLPDGSQRWLR